MKVILELTSLWFVNKIFGATWRVAQVLVVSRPASMDAPAFRSEEGDAPHPSAVTEEDVLVYDDDL